MAPVIQDDDCPSPLRIFGTAEDGDVMAVHPVRSKRKATAKRTRFVIREVR
ncbi:MAG: hypothetical protein AB1599_09710 [Planctomycetota bacterium]